MKTFLPNGAINLLNNTSNPPDLTPTRPDPNPFLYPFRDSPLP
jgi:hypothetical protein